MSHVVGWSLAGWSLCAALFLVGCASAPAPTRMHAQPTHPTGHVYVDETFSEHDRLAIWRAVYSWNEAFHGTREYDVKLTGMSMSDLQDADNPTGSNVMLLQVTSACAFIPVVPNHPEDNTLAWTTLGGHIVWVIRDRMEDELVEPVARHELGHVFGAPDREGPGLMHYQASVNAFRCIDNATVLEVEDFQHLAHGTLRGGCN